jgi:hypothetical protein
MLQTLYKCKLRCLTIFVEGEGVHLVISLAVPFSFKRSSFTLASVGGRPNSFSCAHNKIQVLNNKKRKVFLHCKCSHNKQI